MIDSAEEEKKDQNQAEKSVELCAACSKEQGEKISLNQTTDEQESFMIDCDNMKKANAEKSILKKRKRAKTNVPEEEIKESAANSMIEPTKQAKLGESSSVYKSLFDKGRQVLANDGSDGAYEGDFMTRSAKFGL